MLKNIILSLVFIFSYNYCTSQTTIGFACGYTGSPSSAVNDFYYLIEHENIEEQATINTVKNK